MFRSTTPALVTLLSLAVAGASAQNSTTASPLDIATVEANFQQALLVPSFLSTFSPEAILDVSFTGYGQNSITTGQTESATDVASEPYLEVIPSANASDVSSESSYAVMMVDADIAGTDESGNQTFHWLEYNVALPSGSAPFQVPRGDNATISYVGPGPLVGTGPHRYVVMVYKQPSGFTAPTSPTTFGAYNFASFLQSANLGPLIAANYFTVENGQATVTPSSTSAVVTSTLAVASTTATSATATATHASGSSAASAASGSASKSASATTGSASASATSKSAGERTVAVAGAGLLGALMTVLLAL